MTLMTSCGTTRQARVNEFKELTKDMRINTPDESRIAQILYLKLVNKRQYNEQDKRYAIELANGRK